MGGGAALQVDVLGPIQARDREGREIRPDGLLQRRLLALLVLHRGHVVSPDAAVEALWPSRRPQEPLAALQTHVFRLRRSLPEGLVASTDGGYRLDAADVDVDADRLAEAVRGDRPDDPDVVAVIDAALARWSGPAYAELDELDDGRAEATRLDELRVLAVERRAEARLVSGPRDGLVVELAALADEHPLRERPRELLMAALAGEGRIVEALRVYDDFRRRLGDELGIEPSPVLVARHAELLGSGPEPTWTPSHRLPAALTSLIGREDLVGEIESMAAEHRATTLVGPGGVGKTRLLLEVGARLRAESPERPVVLVELASASIDSAVDEVASALGIKGRPDVGLVERLAAVLADVELVLLLDNCEHVLEPVAELVERCLSTCPGLTVVMTSRERLRVPGERLCAIPPLPVSDGDSSASELFVERAQAVRSDFDPSEQDRARIAEIVRRLDGLPLAIELAAARLHTLDVAEVAAGLDRRFRLLASGARNASRHASLGAAVAWSVGLLDAPLRQTFAELSVFAGTFTVEDVAAICALSKDDGAAALDQLTERSLVMRAPGRRFVLLETLRAYGAEQLEAEGAAGVVRTRHARFMVDRIESADAALLGPAAERLFAEIDTGLPELRNALAWLVESGSLDLAGRMVSALDDYGFLRLRPDVLAWAERVTEADPTAETAVAATVWATSALAAWMAGDLDETEARTARAAAIADLPQVEEPSTVAVMRGNEALFDGRLDDALAHYRRARERAGDDRAARIVAIATELLVLAYAGDPAADELASSLLAELGEHRGPHAAYAWYCAGESDLTRDPSRAQRRFARALELAEASGASFVSGVAGASNASVEARVGDPTVAAKEYGRLLTHWRSAGMWSTQWTMLRSVAILLEGLGRPRDAAVLAGAVLSTRSGHRIFGDDEVALRELGVRLRAALGDGPYEAALAKGAELDGDAAVEHARRSL